MYQYKIINEIVTFFFFTLPLKYFYNHSTAQLGLVKCSVGRMWSMATMVDSTAEDRGSSTNRARRMDEFAGST